MLIGVPRPERAVWWDVVISKIKEKVKGEIWRWRLAGERGLSVEMKRLTIVR